MLFPVLPSVTFPPLAPSPWIRIVSISGKHPSLGTPLRPLANASTRVFVAEIVGSPIKVT